MSLALDLLIQKCLCDIQIKMLVDNWIRKSGEQEKDLEIQMCTSKFGILDLGIIGYDYGGNFQMVNNLMLVETTFLLVPMCFKAIPP